MSGSSCPPHLGKDDWGPPKTGMADDSEVVGDKRNASGANETMEVLETQKQLHVRQGFVKRQPEGSAARLRAGEPQFMLQPAIDDFQISPA